MIGSRRVFHRLLVAMVVLALGAAPLLLQTGAWGIMLVEYSQANSFPTAVGMTFDGSHPCELCRKIQEHEQEQGEQRQQSLPTTRDVILLFHEEAITRISPVEAIAPHQTHGHDPASLLTRTCKPPVPPPRSCV